MPTKPTIKDAAVYDKATNAVNVTNVLAKSVEGTPYAASLPKVNPNDIATLRAFGQSVMTYEPVLNNFLGVINRIAQVFVTSKLYQNPYSIFKKGLLDLGETIEELFVEMARPHNYDPEEASREWMKRELPRIHSRFHRMNYQKFFKATIQENDVRLAFLSWGGIQDLIGRIIDQMYSGAEYSEFQATKYMVALDIHNGRFNPQQIPTVSADNMKAIVTQIETLSLDWNFMSADYNPAGVRTYTDTSRQILLVTPAFQAAMGVEVLATAFNMTMTDFKSRRVLIDGFGKLDIEWLAELFKDDPSYYEFSQDEMAALNQIPIAAIDDNYFFIFENLRTFKTDENGQGLYYNNTLHTWETFSTSDFANRVAFVPGKPEITAVTISPAITTIPVGNKVQLTANVETEFFANQGVTWKSDSEYITVGGDGLVVVHPGASGSATITATCVGDITKTATATVTVL